jgi:hypothetical protein
VARFRDESKARPASATPPIGVTCGDPCFVPVLVVTDAFFYGAASAVLPRLMAVGRTKTSVRGQLGFLAQIKLRAV